MQNPFQFKRSTLVLFIPIVFMALVVLSGNLLYQMEKNQRLSEKKRFMEQRLQHQQAAPLRDNRTVCAISE